MRFIAAAALSAAFLFMASPVSATHYPPAVQDARAYALEQIGRTQFRCLDAIVARESGWNPHAGHVDGYYGIAQTKPATRYGPGWRDDPMVQTKWMLKYIAKRYGNACAAWSAWQRQGFY